MLEDSLVFFYSEFGVFIFLIVENAWHVDALLDEARRLSLHFFISDIVEDRIGQTLLSSWPEIRVDLQQLMQQSEHWLRGLGKKFSERGFGLLLDQRLGIRYRRIFAQEAKVLVALVAK